MGERDQLHEGIESANVEITRLEYDDRCYIWIPAQGVVQDRRRQSPVLVGRQVDNRCAPKAQQANGALDRAVPLVAADDAQSRRARQSVTLHVPARTCKEGIAGRREAGDVPHLGTGDQGEARRRWQPQQLFEPHPADLLQHGLRRTGRHRRRVLVPGRRQPIGGKRGRRGAAHHPAEETTSGAPHNPSRTPGHELVDDLGGIDPGLIEGLPETIAQVFKRDGRGYRSVVDTSQVSEGMRQGALQRDLVQRCFHTVSFPMVFPCHRYRR
jgi:hypothetical protein